MFYLRRLFFYIKSDPKYILRYMLYLVRKSINKKVIYSVKYWFSIVLDLRNEIDSKLYLWSNFEDYLISFYRKFLRTNDVFLDVGANIGLYTLVSSTVIKKWVVVAFEPNQKLVKQLEKSIVINNITNVNIVQKWVWSKEGTMSFNIAEDPAYSSLWRPHNHNVFKINEIELITLDSFFESSKLSKVDFIKIDVEWAELDVIIWADKTIKRYKPTFSIEVSDETYQNFWYTSKILIEKLQSLWYGVYNYTTWMLLEEEVQDYYYYENLIFIHTERKDRFGLDN